MKDTKLEVGMHVIVARIPCANRYFGIMMQIKGKLSRKTQLPVLVGINTSGFHLVNCETNVSLSSA